MKKEIVFSISKGNPNHEETFAISHALAEIVNRTFAYQELKAIGSRWSDPRKNFRSAPNISHQGWQSQGL